jgi:diphthamide synthase (EF-2-diphthine--ammonia ligase)
VQRTTRRMKVVALLSGGKDSCFNMMHCKANGHEIVALATLIPEEGKGRSSFLFYAVACLSVILGMSRCCTWQADRDMDLVLRPTPTYNG